MSEILFVYFSAYWFFASVYMVFKSIKEDQFAIDNEKVQNLAISTSTYIKGLPAIIAAIFVFIMRSNNSMLVLLLTGAFIFCCAGDVGMEKDILIGLSLFLVAQLLFSLAFLNQAFAIGLSIDNLLLTTVGVMIVIMYMFFFLRYLDSSETGLGEIKIPVFLYCVVVSLMLVSSIFIWTGLGKFESIVIVLGAIFFVISDSFIGVHEFHHKISRNVLKVMGTYYLALFLLSLTILFI